MCQKTDFVWDYSKGDIICTSCGTVSNEALLTSDFIDNRDGWSSGSNELTGSSGAPKSLSSPIYVRYFHFNEVLATLTLSGPWINNADYREIKRSLREKQIINPTRSDIQAICKHLNAKFGVQRFSKKYSEKWIQIVYRYNGKRPPLIHPNLIHDLRRDFKIMVSRWSEVERLLLGSKKTDKRVQWPNYLETIYRLLKRRYNTILPGLKPWITRLSVKKRKELKIFFENVFSIVGF
jgi:transcription initiation factor TFIIIB Brf1 subunit/transcription initiation factor TFIIB